MQLFLRDLASYPPDSWDKILVYSDYFEDEDNLPVATMLRWLVKHQRWPRPDSRGSLWQFSVHFENLMLKPYHITVGSERCSYWLPRHPSVSTDTTTEIRYLCANDGSFENLLLLNLLPLMPYYLEHYPL